MNAVYFSGNGKRIFHAGTVADQKRPAALIKAFVIQCFNTDFRAVSKRIAHCNSNQRSFDHRATPYHIPFALFSSRFFLIASIFDSGIMLNGALQSPTL